MASAMEAELGYYLKLLEIDIPENVPIINGPLTTTNTGDNG